jgi:cytochrome c
MENYNDIHLQSNRLTNIGKKEFRGNSIHCSHMHTTNAITY